MYSKDYIYSIELDTKEPSNFHVVVQHASWMNAMQQEYDSIIKNHSWKLVDLPFGKTPIIARWVFKVKEIVDGNVQKLKIYLAAWGFE